MGYSNSAFRFDPFAADTSAFSLSIRVAFLLFCTLMVACQSRPGDELFDTHFQPYKDIISKRGAVDSISPLLTEAMDYYNDAAYEKAFIRFRQLKKDQPENLAVTFYLGISCLELEKPNQAISHFREVLQHEDIIFGPHAEWYLALAHLKAHNPNKAISLLENINRSNPRYRTNSANILIRMPGNASIVGETASSSQTDPM